MHIGSRPLHRRALLTGGGVAIALPLLDAMVPSIARRFAAEPPVRFVAFEMVHGSAGSTAYGRERHLWSPAEAGRAFRMTPILDSLGPRRNELTIVSNTALLGAISHDSSETGPGVDHARSSACFLTGAHPRRGNGIFAGASLDQIYARSIQGETPVSSLQLGIEDPNDAGNGQPWADGYDPAYRQHQLGRCGDAIAPPAAQRGLRDAVRPPSGWDEQFRGQHHRRGVGLLGRASSRLERS